jgi:hypothetical protein
VFGNAVHITASGVFATYYFKGIADGNGNVRVDVRNPTLASLKRALTSGLGPNCFGSLLIAIISTIRALIHQARTNPENDNLLCCVLLCCIECLLSLFQDLLEYFNKYAFTQVAIYGKDYITAAKDTWALVKSHGIDAVINDNLIGTVLSLGGLMIGIITGGIGILAVLISPSIPNELLYYVSIGVVGILVGFAEFSILAGIIDSGVTTTFVCLAEDPQALAQTKPLLYQEIQRVYPQVSLSF